MYREYTFCLVWMHRYLSIALGMFLLKANSHRCINSVAVKDGLLPREGQAWEDAGYNKPNSRARMTASVRFVTCSLSKIFWL